MSVHLIDNSPPNGDYVRYIDALVQKTTQGAGIEPISQVAEEPSAPASRRRRASSGAQGPALNSSLPDARGPSGPPDLSGLMSELLTRLSGELVSKGSQAISAWWPWVAVAVVMTGVLFPVAMAPLAIVAFIVWRFLYSPSGKGKGNKP